MSDTILVGCPACGQVLNIPIQFAGQTGKCNKCGASVVVPKEAPSPSVFQSAPRPVQTGGGSTMRKALTYGFGGCLGVGLAMVLVGGCIVAISPVGQRSRGGATGGQPQTEDTATMEKFNQIQQGMPLHSLNTLMGGPGETISENVIGIGTRFATASAMYGWKAPSGFGGIHVMVQNGAVMSKTQVGL